MPRLFVIDDDRDICEIVRLTLSDQYEVFAETDGRRALERLADVDPDVAVVDLVMPGVDGLTICERIKAERPDTLVVVITAATAGSDLPDTFWRIGTPADGFLTKPFDPRLLVAKIHDLRVKRIEAKRQAERHPPSEPLPPIAKDDETDL